MNNTYFFSDYERHLVKYGYKKRYGKTTTKQRRLDFYELMNDLIKVGEILEAIMEAGKEEE